MSKRNKLEKFADNGLFSNVLENPNFSKPKLMKNQFEEIQLKGRWAKDFFENNHPITLELACGRGDYTIQLAQRHPEKNVIGVDIKGARIWAGAKAAIDFGLKNVAFLRTRIEQIACFFETDEVEELWITFADPFLKNSRSERRLSSNFYLDQYKKILKQGSIIHLKTDDPVLFDFTLETCTARSDYSLLKHNHDIYSSNSLDHPDLEFKTYYELKHLAIGRTIKYCQIQLTSKEN
ncbi:MAG TPA: tRNA (guanosine(46)-N7)-methyltransferase TrmB [Saprospiraceae bacterium]|nr:tRNA (guanosine(46)-N7)-methyltransferase TrmB [Saprospiraceae bacterium]